MLLHKRRRAKAPAINAGSMADIAFLLLIFFLVTTKIAEEKVLKVKLPPWSEDAIRSPSNAAILNIKLNAAGALLVDKKPAQIFELKDLVKNFIREPTTDQGVAKAKGSGIISLQHESRTSYGKYIEVYDLLQLAYNEVHASEAAIRHGMDWEALDPLQRKAIHSELPIKISEAEPFNSLTN